MRIPPAFACLLVAAASSVPAAEKPAGFFTAGAKLVLVNASVLDRNHRPVRGLDRADFRLFENQVEQRISFFGEEEQPLSLAIVLDSSGSMQTRIAGAARALRVLLDHPGDGDEFSLITFAARAEIAVPWTADVTAIETRAASTRAAGNTALLDAIHLTLSLARTASNQRRAVLILSDGGDNRSRRSERQISRILQEADVQMYAVDMAPPEIPGVRSPEELLGPDLLERLCSRAGGRYFPVGNQRDLQAVAEQISREMRCQYMLGYVPSNPAADGLFRSIRLQLLPAGSRRELSVYWRRGYRPKPAE